MALRRAAIGRFIHRPSAVSASTGMPNFRRTPDVRLTLSRMRARMSAPSYSSSAFLRAASSSSSCRTRSASISAGDRDSGFGVSGRGVSGFGCGVAGAGEFGCPRIWFRLALTVDRLLETVLFAMNESKSCLTHSSYFGPQNSDFGHFSFGRLKFIPTPMASMIQCSPSISSLLGSVRDGFHLGDPTVSYTYVTNALWYSR